MTDQERQGDRWQAAHEARAEANQLAARAAEAAAHAAELEAHATADDAGVEHEPADPLSGTWEGRVGGASEAEEPFRAAGPDD